MIEQINPHLPHHFYIGLLIAGFGFRFVWPFFPRLGVLFVGIGMSVMTDDFITHWTGHQTLLDAVENVLYELAVRVNLVTR